MSPADVVPEVLWQPGPDRIARAPDHRLRRVRRPTAPAASLPDYQSLWAYSTGDLGRVLVSGRRLLRRALARAARPRCWPAAVMPGADWFPGGTLNYAEHALAGRRDDRATDPAVIAVDEDGTEQLLTLGRAARPGRRRPGGPAPARGRRRATGWSRWCRTACTRWSPSWPRPRSARCGRRARRTSGPAR